MKKMALYLGIILGLFAILYAVDYASNQQVNNKLQDAAEKLYNTQPDQLTKATRDQLNDDNYQRIILPDSLEEKLNNKESLFVYMFSPVCSYCQATTPVLEEIAKDLDVDYVQLNVYEFADMWDVYNIEATPTLIYFQDGVEAERLSGGIVDDATKQIYIDFLQKYGS